MTTVVRTRWEVSLDGPSSPLMYIRGSERPKTSTTICLGMNLQTYQTQFWPINLLCVILRIGNLPLRSFTNQREQWLTEGRFSIFGVRRRMDGWMAVVRSDGHRPAPHRGHHSIIGNSSESTLANLNIVRPETSRRRRPNSCRFTKKRKSYSSLANAQQTDGLRER